MRVIDCGVCWRGSDVCETPGSENRPEPTGLEPATPAVTGQYSNQLSYGSKSEG